MERLLYPDSDIIEGISESIRGHIYVSWGWTKAINLSYAVNGPWAKCEVDPYSLGSIDLYAWLVNQTQGHWYSCFEVQGKFSRHNDLHNIRQKLFFENKDDAMMCKLTCNLDLNFR
jgi:hypothetical protein